MTHKRKLIEYSLLALFWLASLGIATHMYPQSPTTAPVQSIPAVQAIANTYPTTADLFAAINTQRTTVGLPALARDARLDASSAAKCSDMLAKNYWSHYSPEGVSPQVFITAQVPNLKYWGENLSFGYSDTTGVVNGWMGSPDHKANILNPHYSEVGYAVCHSPLYIGGDKALVVQHFIGL